MPARRIPSIEAGSESVSESVLKIVKRTLTPNEIRALHTTPITLVPAQGIGKIIVVHRFLTRYVFIDEDYDGAGINYGFDGNKIGGNIMLNNGGINFTVSEYADWSWFNYDIPINSDLTAYTSGSPITNNDANGTVTIVVYYSILDL